MTFEHVPVLLVGDILKSYVWEKCFVEGCHCCRQKEDWKKPVNLHLWTQSQDGGGIDGFETWCSRRCHCTCIEQKHFMTNCVALSERRKGLNWFCAPDFSKVTWVYLDSRRPARDVSACVKTLKTCWFCAPVFLANLYGILCGACVTFYLTGLECKDLPKILNCTFVVFAHRCDVHAFLLWKKLYTRLEDELHFIRTDTEQAKHDTDLSYQFVLSIHWGDAEDGDSGRDAW